MKYQRLFTPIKIRNLELKNRILMPAIHLTYNKDGYANDRLCDFYYRRAEGGAGLVFVGGCRFDDYGGSPGMMSLASDDFIPGYKKFTEGMHKRGAKVAVQLYHAGAYAHSAANEGRQALAPSAYISKFTHEMTKEASVEELHEITKKWAEAAVRAKKAGFDMVEISASAGYLICQFLSPITNKRKDEYGGSYENRCKFPKEVVNAVRTAVGNDYPICVRIAGNDFVPGSNVSENAVEFAKLLESWGVDMINVTGGWHETNIPQLTGDLPQAGFYYLASAVKSAVSIPVAASNRISIPDEAEKLLARGCCDMVSIGRPLISDPDWCAKAQKGEADTIRRCFACNQACLAKTFFAQPVECLINPEAGFESQVKPLTATENPKNILVAGGGVAGCEFAIRASMRGHKVVIWEKTHKVGGQLHMAAAAPTKGDFLNLYDYYTAMIRRLNIEVVYGKKADADEILKAGFDIVVTATGNIPKTIEIPKGIETVCTANEIFAGEKIAGKNVVIIGGGPVGLECAQYLAREASLTPENAYFMLSQRSESLDKIMELIDHTDRNITVIDMAKVGVGFEPGTAWPLLKDLDRFKVNKLPFTEILDYGDNEVNIKTPVPKTKEQKLKEKETGIKEAQKFEEKKIQCDTLIVAIGADPDNSLYEELKTKGVEAYNIGDSDHVSRMSDAIKAAYDLANEL